MQLDRIAPRVGSPIRVHLDKGPEGQPQQSKFGADYKYLVNFGQANLYLKPMAREALVRSGAKQGDDVQILKQLHGNAESYDIRVMTNGVASAPAARSNGNGKVHQLPARAYCQPESNGAHPEPGRPAAPAPAAAPAQQPAPAQPGSSAASHIAMCLRQAIDAVADTQEYARLRSVGVTFLGSDVRAIANSIYINDQKRQGVK
jgi:hypothetical protein